MECSVAGEQMSSWLDGELPPAEAASVEAHVSACPNCRSLANALQSQDSGLRDAFEPHRQAADRLAGEVLKQLDADALVARTTTQATKYWGSLLLAAAAGFLLAVVLFQPWKTPTANPLPVLSQLDALPPVEIPAARLVVATGGIDLRRKDAAKWLACPEPTGLECTSGSLIRTGPDSRCELATAAGCIVRLNTDTEITLTSSDAIEVRQGQIWCSAPENGSLKILAPQADTLFACTSNSSVITQVRQGGDVQVTAAGGQTELQTPRATQRLERGESASIVAGQIVKLHGSYDPLLAESWMHSLLVRKGHADKGLGERVDQLLAHMGQSKLTFLYEQEIRGLGEYAALPLLRYVQSPLSFDDAPRRQTAMRILSDIAPSWMVPDLIGLLADQTPAIRVLSAQTLHRLTGLDQGLPPDKWRGDPSDYQPALDRWHEWRTKNGKEYSRPDAVPQAISRDVPL